MEMPPPLLPDTTLFSIVMNWAPFAKAIPGPLVVPEISQFLTVLVRALLKKTPALTAPSIRQLSISTAKGAGGPKNTPSHETPYWVWFWPRMMQFTNLMSLLVVAPFP